MITFIQLFLLVFLLFALSRVVLRFKGGALTLVGFLFWSGLFSVAIITVLIPGLSSAFARSIGIGRGVDAIVYSSIVLLFYLVFRLHIFVEDLRHDITELVKKLALKEFEETKKKHATKD